MDDHVTGPDPHPDLDPDLLAIVQRLIATQLGISPAMVEPGLRFQEDLGLDSTDAAELLIALERDTGLAVEVESLADIASVGGIVARLSALRAVAP
jgi:acyl carrier protein